MVQKSELHCDIRACFATAFRNWREKNKVLLKEVASDLGVSVATVNTWESGKSFPSGRHFEMLVDYMGVPPCRLFCVMADRCVPPDCMLAIPHLPVLPKKKR